MVPKSRVDPFVSIIHNPEILRVVAVAAAVGLAVTVEVVAEVVVAAAVGLVIAVAVAAVADLAIVVVVEEVVAVIVEAADGVHPEVVENQEESLPLKAKRLPSKSSSHASFYYAHLSLVIFTTYISCRMMCHFTFCRHIPVASHLPWPFCVYRVHFV
jgi:hypothetical protein